VLASLPSPAEVSASLRALEADQEVRPTLEQRLELVSAMCDIWGLEPPVRFISYMADKLAGFSTATLVNTIDTALTTLEPQNGRHPSPKVLLDLAGKISTEMTKQCVTLKRLAHAQSCLGEVVAATEGLEKPDGYIDEDDCPF
jgi:hypothetical protein